MSSHKPASSLASSLPSLPEDAHFRPESITAESDTATTPGNPFDNPYRQSTLSFATTLPGTPQNEIDSEKTDSMLFEKKGPVIWETSTVNHEERVKELGDLNTMVDEKPEFFDPDGMKVRQAQRLMKLRKLAFQCTIFGFK